MQTFNIENQAIYSIFSILALQAFSVQSGHARQK